MTKVTILTITFLAGMLAIVPIGASADLNDNLVARVGFDANTLDFSGNDNDGTITGTERYDSGQLGLAFDFDGSSYVTLTNESNFDFEDTDAFSICSWFQTDVDNSSTFVIVSKFIGGSTAGWQLSDTVLGFGMHMQDTSSTILSVYIPSATFETRDGNWHHGCMTYDGSEDESGINLYLDGTWYDNTVSSNSNPSSMLNNISVRIGDRGDGNSKWDGPLDDVRIYDVELTSSEVQEIYELSPYVVIEKHTAEIDDLYDFWADLKDSIITWLAGRP